MIPIDRPFTRASAAWNASSPEPLCALGVVAAPAPVGRNASTTALPAGGCAAALPRARSPAVEPAGAWDAVVAGIAEASADPAMGGAINAAAQSGRAPHAHRRTGGLSPPLPRRPPRSAIPWRPVARPGIAPPGRRGGWAGPCPRCSGAAASRSSHAGIRHVAGPMMCSTAGSSRQRITRASRNTALARLRPNSLMTRSSPSMNDRNTHTMIAAAAVTTRPVSARPSRHERENYRASASSARASARSGTPRNPSTGRTRWRTASQV